MVLIVTLCLPVTFLIDLASLVIDLLPLALAVTVTLCLPLIPLRALDKAFTLPNPLTLAETELIALETRPTE